SSLTSRAPSSPSTRISKVSAEARITADSAPGPSAALRHMAESPASISATFAGRASPGAISCQVSFKYRFLPFSALVCGLPGRPLPRHAGYWPTVLLQSLPLSAIAFDEIVRFGRSPTARRVKGEPLALILLPTLQDRIHKFPG